MTEGTNQGLFVIVAVEIFGIFVLISYLLFNDNLKTGLASIFEDSLNIALGNETEEETINVPSIREDSKYLYAKIREANPKEGETEIWVQAEKLSDGTLKLVKSSTTDSNYTTGTAVMTGNLSMPDTIGNKKITVLDYTFSSAKFTGELKLPKYTEEISQSVFNQSKFSGTLKLPKNVKTIGMWAFNASKFTGELTLPDTLI